MGVLLDLPYIDIHTHHTVSEAGVFAVKNIIISEDDLPDSCCSVGIHPWYIAEKGQQYAILEKYVQEKQVVAIGECGLDKVVEVAWDKQVEVFKQQIALAERHRKPLVIHCVKAYAEVLSLLHDVSVPVVFHGFNKNMELALQLIQKGYYLSLGTAILGGRLDLHIQQLPLDRLFLETDDKPVAIMDVYAYFCTVRKMSLPELKQQMVANFERVFKYPVL